MCAVFLLECHNVVESEGFHLLTTNLHHTLADVCTYQSLGIQHLGCHDGKIACTGGNVEQRLGLIGCQSLDGLVAPPLVDVPG